MKSLNFLQWIVMAWLGISGLGISATAHAQQSPELKSLYGRGVHSFFSNQVSHAERQFTSVIDAGSTDPRVYYFRSMARLRMGLTEEAQSDMRIGASYEARRPGDRAAVSKSLQRLQGSGRLMLERFRREARLLRGEQRRTQARTRYQRLQRREADVLRQPVDLPLEQLLGGNSSDAAKRSSPPESTKKIESGSTQDAADNASPATISQDKTLPNERALPDNSSDPFGGATATPSSPPEPGPEAMPQPAATAEAEPAAGEDPFGQPETSDPFGETSPAKASPANPTEKDATTIPQVDVFGEPAQATHAANEKGAVANSPGNQGTAGSKQNANPKRAADKKNSDKADNATSKSKAAKGTATTPQDSAPNDSTKSGVDSMDEQTSPNNDEEDPFGGF